MSRGRKNRRWGATDSSLLRGIAVGVVPLAVLGLITGLAMFYPEDESTSDQSLLDAFASAPAPTAAAPSFPVVPSFPGASSPPVPESPPATTTAPSGARAGGRQDGGGTRSTQSAQSRSVPPPVRLIDRPLSAFGFRRAVNFWGPVERNTSNGEREAGDGGTITIDGVRFGHGLGVHAPSQVEVALGGGCTAFNAFVGLDDEEGPGGRKNVGAVVFSVVGDGRVLYRSPVVRPDDEPRPVTVGLAGVRVLGLHVDDLGEHRNDHADWAVASVRCPAG